MRRYGFGFSYVYKKALALKHPFNESKTFGEDLEFVSQVLKVRLGALSPWFLPFVWQAGNCGLGVRFGVSGFGAEVRKN